MYVDKKSLLSEIENNLVERKSNINDYYVANLSSSDKFYLLKQDFINHHQDKEHIETICNYLKDVMLTKKMVFRDIFEDFFNGNELCILMNHLTNVKTLPDEVTSLKDNSVFKMEKLYKVLADHFSDEDFIKSVWIDIEYIFNHFPPTILIYIVKICSFNKVYFDIDSTISIEVESYEFNEKLELSRSYEKIVVFDKNSDGPKGVGKDKDGSFIRNLLNKPDDLKLFEELCLTQAKNILDNYNITINNIYDDFMNGTNFITIMCHQHRVFIPTYQYVLEPQNKADIDMNLLCLLNILNRLRLSLSGWDSEKMLTKNKYQMLIMHLKANSELRRD